MNAQIALLRVVARTLRQRGLVRGSVTDGSLTAEDVEERLESLPQGLKGKHCKTA